jgi:threonine 3-dehydrogenase
MKALVKKLPEKGLWLEDVDEPICGLNEVKIKIKKTSICGTDLHIYNWDEWSQETIPVPMTIGHEFVGTIYYLKVKK